MTRLNTWLPGDNTYAFPPEDPGVTLSLVTADIGGGAQGLVQRAVIADSGSGFGTTFDMVSPPWEATQPPKIAYRADRDMTLVVKDAAGWLWAAPMRAQATMAERGWSWNRFALHTVQENTGSLPTAPAAGVIQLYQIQGAESISYPATVDIAYIAARTPARAVAGSIRKARITSKESGAITLKVGDVVLQHGIRDEVRYLGALPFGLQKNGPSRTGRAPTPYRGPFIAGYQSGTPWVKLGDAARLGAMLDFMAESQLQFAARHPQGLLGPFMHAFLPATWDSQQVGPVNSWVWDAPDGNPAWPGWQWRAFDSMGATWAAIVARGGMPTQAAKAALVCGRFIDWLHGWLMARPEADYLPSSWGPPGWSQGVPLPASSYLDPQGTTLEPHDVALAMKGALYSFKAGADQAKCRAIVRRCARMLQAAQVGGTGPMRGAFSLSPSTFKAYGFQQGEILDALALALRTPGALVAA